MIYTRSAREREREDRGENAKVKECAGERERVGEQRADDKEERRSRKHNGKGGKSESRQARPTRIGEPQAPLGA